MTALPSWISRPRRLIPPLLTSSPGYPYSSSLSHAFPSSLVPALLALVPLLLFPHAASSLFLPPSSPSPIPHPLGDEVVLTADPLFSFVALSRPYVAFPFCPALSHLNSSTHSSLPQDRLQAAGSSSARSKSSSSWANLLRLGLTSPDPVPSAYRFPFLAILRSVKACEVGPLTASQAQAMQQAIARRYVQTLRLDGLPMTVYSLANSPGNIPLGVPLGYQRSGRYYVFNHLKFNILVHPLETEGQPGSVTANRTDGLDVGGSNASLTTRTGESPASVAEAAVGPTLATRGGAERAEGDASGKSSLVLSLRHRNVQLDKPGDALPQRHRQRGLLWSSSPPAAASAQHSTPAAAKAMYSVVGLEVLACSIANGNAASSKLPRSFSHLRPDECMGSPMQMVAENTSITYTYSTQWEHSTVPWSRRWDPYLRTQQSSMHLCNLINSASFALVLGFLLLWSTKAPRGAPRGGSLTPGGSKAASILALAQGPSAPQSWFASALAHPVSPSSALLLCVLVASGTQLTAAMFLLSLLPWLGLVSLADPPGLLLASVVSYVLMSPVGGFFASFLPAKLLLQPASGKGSYGVNTSVKAACFFPLVAACLAVPLDILLWACSSPLATPAAFYSWALLLWSGPALAGRCSEQGQA